MCYVGCKQVGKLGLSCGAGGAGAGAGGAGAGAGGCPVGYSSKADWDEIWQQFFTQMGKLGLSDTEPANYKNRIENNHLKNNCMPTILVDEVSYAARNGCLVNDFEGMRCKQAEATAIFYSYSKNEIMEIADLTKMIKDEIYEEEREKDVVMSLDEEGLYKRYTLNEFVEYYQDIIAILDA